MLEVISERDLEIIKQIWEVCKRHHQVHSRHFKTFFREMTFDHFVNNVKTFDRYRLEVVYSDKIALGFCIAGIKNQEGIILGLYVYDDLRGKGLGSFLVNRMKLWLETQVVLRVVIEVYAGNEEVISFLKKNGFKTSKYIMESVDRGD